MVITSSQALQKYKSGQSVLVHIDSPESWQYIIQIHISLYSPNYLHAHAWTQTRRHTLINTCISYDANNRTYYDDYLVERTSLASIVRFSSLVITVMPGVSRRFLIQSVCCRLLMNMYSAPMCSQYIAWSAKH